MRNRIEPLKVFDRGSKIEFTCKGAAEDIVRVPVRVVESFRGCRFEVADDADGLATAVLDIEIEGRPMFPRASAVPSTAFGKTSKNNLLSLATCTAGGTIAITVKFIKASTFVGTLRRRNPKTDGQYVTTREEIEQHQNAFFNHLVDDTTGQK